MFSLASVIIMKLFAQVDMTGNPLLTLSVISGMAAIQFFSLGLIGEVNARIYFNNQDRNVYAVRETLNFQPTSAHTPAADARAKSSAHDQIKAA